MRGGSYDTTLSDGEEQEPSPSKHGVITTDDVDVNVSHYQESRC